MLFISPIVGALSPSSYFFWHSLFAVLLVSLFYLALGVLVGWLLWRHCRATVERVQKENDELLAELESARERYRDSQAEYELLTS